MARKDDAAFHRRPADGEQVSLFPAVVRHPFRSDAMIGQVRLDPLDQRQVAPVGGGVEGDQRFEDAAGGVQVGHAASLAREMHHGIHKHRAFTSPAGAL